MNTENESAVTPPRRAWWELLLAALAVALVALAVRAVVYVRVENVLHADEALQGLIARHILDGNVQLYTYGRANLGTLQAHWIALCFALFGATPGVLKWAVAVASLVLILANYLLAREAAGGDRRAGFVAAILTAVGPLYLIEWSLRPRGGHLEVATLAALGLWALLRAMRAAGGRGTEPARPAVAVRWLCLGSFFMGLGWWANLTMFYAIAACLVGFLLWGGRLRGRAGAWIGGSLCFLAGSLPFWLYNAKYLGRSFVHIWNGVQAATHGLPLFDRVVGLFQYSIPILIGARQTEADTTFGAAIVLILLAAYGVALAAAWAAGRRPVAVEPATRDDRPPPARAGVGLLFVFCAIALVIFVCGPFWRQVRDPNALLPLYGAILPLAGIGIVRLWDRGGTLRALAGMTMGALLLFHAYGYRRAEPEPVQPIAQEYQVPEDLDALHAFLEAHEIRHIFTNYFIGYRLAFETEERIIPCTHGDPVPERYNEYARQVRETDQPVAYIVGTRMADWLRAALTQAGIDFQETKFENFHIVYDLDERFREYPLGPDLCVPAEVDVGTYPKQCGPGQEFEVETTFANRGKVGWLPPPSWRGVRLSYHILDAETGEMLRFENSRVPLERAVAPGTSITTTLTIRAPEEPGDYAFVPDLVIEGVAWFSQLQPGLTAKTNWREFTVRE